MQRAATILVTGSGGQLGFELQSVAKEYPLFNFHFLSHEQLSITDPDSVDRALSDLRPDFLINCAAYTGVDRAEEDELTAMAVNATAVGYLSEACNRWQTKMIHISTDYVYDETTATPLRETDPTNPLGIYGITKLAGEWMALEKLPDVIIIRTSWLYSSYGKNFVKTMLRLMSEKESVKVVYDQVGSPTYAADLASAIMLIIHSEKWVPGVYNFANAGAISWYDLASEIRQMINSDCVVYPITSKEYPTPARRPKYSVLDTTKIRETYGVDIVDWKKSLKTCIEKLTSQELT